jgi:rhamnosyltransferase
VTSPAICAVVVTYHPTICMLDNLPKILRQVDGMIVVDNGSNDKSLDALRSMRKSVEFQLIENGDNLGIAAALNCGICWARRNGYNWVILFDQDSEITDGFVSQMFASWQDHPERARIASMHPTHIETHTGIATIVHRAADGGPVKSITSGALMPMWIFAQIGLFETDYFIDEVDSEFCYRIRAAGYLIADSTQARLLHKVGDSREIRIFGFRCRPTNHSPMRRYYMSRNRIAVYRKYIHVFPSWIVHSMNASFRETVKCFLTEKNRPRKFLNFLLGTWDGLTGRMGRREGLQ